MTHRILCAAACVLAMGAVPSAFAQSDREVYESAVDRAASICPGHSKERTTPAVRAVPVGALRVLAKHRLVMCPDRRLDSDAPVVWYGEAGAYAWNPEVEGAGKVIAEKIDAMTRSEEFPVETLVWDAQGNVLTGRTVPAFEARPGSYQRR